MKKKVKWLVLAFVLVCAIVGFKPTQSKAAGKYLVKVNKQACVITVYKQNKKGKYTVPVKAMVCSPGPATPVGTFSLKEKMRWHVLDGPCYGQYCSRIQGGFLFHSVWYYNQTKNSQAYRQYNRLGTLASHGCVRVTVADAKWIYDNVASGSTIKIYKSKNPGPLGKPKAIKVKGYTGWDPTDPDRSNPYRKKKPVIKGAKNKNVTYGASYSVKSGVSAKNSTGFSATKLIKVKVQYKEKGAKKYKTVKKVSTKKPGTYKITYSVKDEIGHKASKTVIHKVLTKVKVSKIKLNHSSYKLYLGAESSKKNVTLKTTSITPKSASYKAVSISSSNKSIATVDSKGKVTAKKAGTCTITFKAKDGSGTKATCKITVIQRATSITLTAPKTKVELGETMQLTTSVAPSSTSNKKLNFTSSNPAVATVSSTGVVTPVATGTVQIKAETTDGSKKSKTITLMVVCNYDHADSIATSTELDYAGNTVDEVKAELPQTVKVYSKGGKEATLNITWACGDFDDHHASNEFTGTVTLPAGWAGTAPTFTVTVNLPIGN